ncbi:MAG: four helix bundle protein [Bacteroidota bacterium]|jgi:four helix bundle protein
MRDFRKLNIWTDSMALVELVYQILKLLPDSEKFSMQLQMQRSAISIPSNIAEGCSRSSELDFKRFLEIAIGSTFELETQVLLAVRIGYFTEQEAEPVLAKINQVQKQLNAFISSIKNRVKKNT